MCPSFLGDRFLSVRRATTFLRSRQRRVEMRWGGVPEPHLCTMNCTYVRMYLRIRLRAVFNTFIDVFKRLKALLDKDLQDAIVRKPG